jgi:assimilatory nitrate reductase catalytic subunit
LLQHQGGNAAQRLASLQRALRCGTACGSCLPALRRLVDEMPSPVLEPCAAQAAG